MKKISAALLLAAAATLAGCGGAANNSTVSNNANIKGTNTNTGYLTNSETNAKPTIPANATNIEPPSIGNSNTRNTNTNANHNTNVNKK